MTHQIRVLLAALFSLGCVALLLWQFHNRFWWPVDEGVYAYVAQRVLAGDRLHIDLIDLHGGYGNFVNVLAFRLFGEDLLSLRYPLALLTLLQSALVFRLMLARGPALAGVAAVAVGALSFIQFLNPSANWYALFLCVVALFVMQRFDTTTREGLLLLGAVLGFCFLVRQLSGVILALGVLTWLLLPSSGERREGAIAGRAFAMLIGLGLAGYLYSKSSATALLLFGLWPLLVVGLAISRATMDARTLGRILAWLLTGAVLAALPLVIYHSLNGALVAWLKDIFITALLIHGQDFIGQEDFSMIMGSALTGFDDARTVKVWLSLLGWIGVVLVPPATGFLCWRAIRGAGDATVVSPLTVVAPFWALVAAHYQIPIYLFFALPVVIVALLQQARPSAGVTVAVLLSAWAVAFQAGQPLNRSLEGILRGDRVAPAQVSTLPRVSLRINAVDQAIYGRVIGHIESVASGDEALMTLPMDPELNFMTARKSPLPYYGTPLGLRREADVTKALETLEEAAPLFVVHRRDDKYLTPLSALLLDAVRQRAPAPTAIGPFDLYRLVARDDERRSPPRAQGNAADP